MNLRCNTCDGIFNTVDIRFTKKCDNNCSFCIEKKSSIKGYDTNVPEILKSIKKVDADEILILGGEPFLEIQKLYHLVSQLSDKKIFITTSLPITIKENWNMFCHIMKYVTGLNVSIQSVDYLTNNFILKASSLYDRIDLFKQINKTFPNKTRACINLVKGGVDNEFKLVTTLTTLLLLKTKKVKINELCHSKEYISFEKITNIKMKSPYSHGCYTKVLSEFFPLMNIELKRSCFITEKTLNATFMDLVKTFIKRYISKPVKNKFCVIYENGKIEKKWMEK